MANEEQLSILKQGVKAWNEWRKDKPDVGIDLSETNLGGENLKNANLIGANFWETLLNEADLSEANLTDADLRKANFTETKLMGANLEGANLMLARLGGSRLMKAVLAYTNLSYTYLVGANLTEANLTGANFTLADLAWSNLREADLTESNLREANLSRVNLWGTDLTKSEMDATIFGDNDLSGSLGLETVVHIGPSTIGLDTIQRSMGRIPIAFLRGCGLSDWEIEQVKLYNPDLSNDEITQIQYKVYDLRASQAIQISPIFFSYSHSDEQFVQRIKSRFTDMGIRYWSDTHDMKAGRREKQIDRAIRQNPTVLLMLSKHSLSNDWVEHEVRLARDLEKELGRDTLCPIALDDSWKSSRWPKRIMEQIMEYNILDFSEWEDDVKFEGMFRKLIDGLELFYKG